MKPPPLNRTATNVVTLVVFGLQVIFVASHAFAQDSLNQDSLDRDYSDALPRIAPTEPTEALSRFEIDPSLKIEVMAAEPLVIDPVAIAFDEFGRAFVVEMRGYSENGSKKMGRIRLLEDTNDDGRFDRSTIFADQFESPTAVVCVRGGILVGDAPHLWFLKDTDDDQIADIRQVAFSGFGNSNIQQLFNNFQWGIDNRIYGAVGGNGGRVAPVDLSNLRLDVSTTPDPLPKGIDFRGNDFAISPDDFRMSRITGGGQFGMTFDQWGNRYVCSNSDHCQQVVLDPDQRVGNPLARIGKTRTSIAVEGPAAEVFRISPVEPWRTVRTRLRTQGLVKGPVEGGGRAAGYFTSATGITVYRGDALPEEYSGNVFIGDVGSNLVHRKRIDDVDIEKKAYRIEQDTEFLRSTDNWFRPVQMANSPDGSLIVLDMYRETVEHPASLPELIKKHLDLNSGNDRGRIFRIVPRGFVHRKRLLPGDADLTELVEMLEHPNGWHRETAARLLAECDGNEVSDLLAKKCFTTRNPETRIRILYLLANHQRLDPTWLVALLQDPHPYVRIHALKIADRSMDDRKIQDRVRKMYIDHDIRIRFQVALRLGQQNADVTKAFVALALRDGANRWMQVALLASAGEQRSQILTGLIAALYIPVRTEDHTPLHPAIIELARQIGLDDSEDDLATAVHEVVNLVPTHATLAGDMLLQLTGNDLLASRVDLLLINQHELSLQKLVDRLANSALETASNPDASLVDRISAIRMLRMAQPDVFASMMPDWLDPQLPPEIRKQTIETASHFSAPQISRLILERLRSMDPRLRRQSILVLLSREVWTLQLLESIQANTLNPVLMEASARQRLTQHRNPEIRAIATSILGSQTNADRAKVLDHYQSLIENVKGDANRGRIVFRKSCSSCHRLENVGTETGPNLAAYANRGALAILTHVLDPNREVDPRYLSYTVLLIDGRLLQGIISSENATTVVLQDNEGKLTPIARNEIDELQSSSLSLMPENLENEIDIQAMADLVAYLLGQSG